MSERNESGAREASGSELGMRCQSCGKPIAEDGGTCSAMHQPWLYREGEYVGPDEGSLMLVPPEFIRAGYRAMGMPGWVERTLWQDTSISISPDPEFEGNRKDRRKAKAEWRRSLRR